MKATEFKHQNIVFAKDQPEYQPLPALRLEGQEGHVISCWKMSFMERVRVLFTVRIWLNLMSFNKPLTPSYMSTKRKEVFSIPGDEKRLLSIGTKSVLFGAHCFLIHPFFVLAAWIKLYGFGLHSSFMILDIYVNRTWTARKA